MAAAVKAAVSKDRSGGMLCSPLHPLQCSDPAALQGGRTQTRYRLSATSVNTCLHLPYSSQPSILHTREGPEMTRGDAGMNPPSFRPAEESLLESGLGLGDPRSKATFS